MHLNVWNLKTGKQRLQIIERTQAQRKHLINILSAKSKIDNHSQIQLKHFPNAPINITQQKFIQLDNQSMIKRIGKIAKIKHSPSLPTEIRSVSRNLQSFSRINRSIRLKEIEQQNTKIFSRLIMTSPTIKREQWISRNIQTCKYKQNLHRGKYLKPDYSQQACKMMKTQPKFRNLNMTSCSQRQKNLPLKHSRCIQP